MFLISFWRANLRPYFVSSGPDGEFGYRFQYIQSNGQDPNEPLFKYNEKLTAIYFSYQKITIILNLSIIIVFKVKL